MSALALGGTQQDRNVAAGLPMASGGFAAARKEGRRDVR